MGAQTLKVLVEETFDAHCEARLYTLKFHFLYYVVENLDGFGSSELLNSFGFELFETHMKLVCRSTSQRQGSALE